jgi:hypothetical protein
MMTPGRRQPWIGARSGDCVPCLNLFPTYASRAQLGTATYAEYLSRFIEVVNPLMLCYDNYPFLKNGTDRRNFEDFFLNLELVRDVSVKHDIPAWLAGQADWWTGLREASEAELRVQAYSALAYGFTGIGYFTYWPVNRPYEAAVDYQGKRQPLYEAIRRVNLRVKELGDMLVSMRSLGVYHTGQRIPEGCRRLPVTVPLLIEGKGTLVVGLFAGEKGRYAMLVNRNYTQPTKFLVTLQQESRGLWVVEGSGSELAIDEKEDGQGRLSLEPGGGVLLRLGTSPDHRPF